MKNINRGFSGESFNDSGGTESRSTAEGRDTELKTYNDQCQVSSVYQKMDSCNQK